MPTIEEFLDDAKRRMDRSIETTRTEFNSVRTGRASAALLDRISIDYYGTPTPLKNMATIGVPEPRMITVQPFDPSQIKAIEKAVQESDLGLTPSNDGKLIRLPIPQLTEERRKELVKLVRKYGEEGKVAIRNVRRDVMKHLEELVRNGEVGDDELRGEKQVQKHRRAHGDDRRADQAQGNRDHGGLRSPPTSNRPTSPAASRSSWTATAAGRSGADCGGGRPPRGRAALRRTVEAAIDLGVQSLAVYAFSTENWTRPADEVESLMEIFGETIERELPDLARQGVRTRFIGRRDRVPDWLHERMAALEAETAGNDRLSLWIAFDYGGRAELVDARAG